jgi:hypothetical protein
MNTYEMTDEYGRPVRTAHISSHRSIIGVVTGIEAITTRQ